MPDNDTSQLLTPAGNEVLIRMYGQGVGDCFLLAFPGASSGDARPVYVLIDCGVIGGTPGGSQRMQAVVADIAAATGGRLDLLIVTHEHWDHLSGFVQAQEQWDRIQVDALWMAWTENGDSEGLPAVLKRILARQHRALALVADQAMRLGSRAHDSLVLGLMGFLSDATQEGLPFSAAPTVRDALNAAREQAPAGAHSSLEPGQVRRLPGTGTAVYVLGPPRDDRRLRQIDPSRRDPETYDHNVAFSLRAMADGPSPLNVFATPLLAHDPAPPGVPVDGDRDPSLAQAQDLYERSFPFDRFTRVWQPDAEAAATQDPRAYPGLASYASEENHWRRIDFDWLAAADAFALQADSLTNNTSLALAFELPSGADGERNVLLFPADAQVGALLSWDDIPAWNAAPDAGQSQPEPDIDDLLKRTVFLKVGHHGSHNATLKAKGIERLRQGAPLTAFVPVSPGVARQIKGWSHMPLDAMLTALAQRSDNRVVLANGDLWPAVPPADLPQARAAIGITVAPTNLPEMKRSRDNTTVQPPSPLWIQTAIPY